MSPSGIGAYLDADPVRRRLRAALLVCFFGALVVLWWTSVGKAWGAWARYERSAPYTQGALDAEFQKCRATAPPADASDDDLRDFFGDGAVGKPGQCHPADAREINAAVRASAFSSVKRELGKPLMSGTVALIVTCALWIVIPLAERRSR